jgi:1-acyl-sn-glycerol-3-phosphate acyltransferase
MSALFYNACKLSWRLVMVQTLRETIVNPEAADRAGPFLLAVTHISHLEPLLVGVRVKRRVRWMSRIEFYRPWWGRTLLNLGGAFPVDRYGNSLPAVRRAERLLRQGEVVGIFPEGGVAQGARSVLRGAAVKQGVCTLAIQAQVPVVPVVVLGTEKLNCVGPWLPARRGRLLMAFGEAIDPPARGGRGGDGPSRRELRRALHERLVAGFGAAYGSLAAHATKDELRIPEPPSARVDVGTGAGVAGGRP